MPFPITHLHVADCILSLCPMPEDAAAAFLLGSIAPDGVHYRPDFVPAVKKISHLCPVSDQPWGSVTENDKWLKQVLEYNQNTDPFILGYCVHIIADILHNRELWMQHRLAQPQDAAKGYQSRYQKDWEQIDAQLYQTLPAGNRIESLLPLASARGLPNLVSAEEIHAIRHNILYISYPNKPPADISGCRYLTFGQVEEMIIKAADLAASVLSITKS